MKKRKDEQVAMIEAHSGAASYVDGSAMPFDGDDPMKCIVYDEWVRGPIRSIVHRVACLCEEGRMEDAIRAASELGRRDLAITPALITELNPVMSKLVIRHAYPKLAWDISPLEPLIDRLWRFVTHEMDLNLFVAVEPWIYRWYEHQGRYNEAKRIQRRFIAFYKGKGERAREAGTINNMAYEYQFEGRWGKAIALFRKAAKTFEELGVVDEYANSRANYWICRFGSGDMKARNIRQLQQEIAGIVRAIRRPGSFYERKPLILQPRIAEWYGNMDEAIRFAEKAIAAGQRTATRYPETDGKYLDFLQKRKGGVDSTPTAILLLGRVGIER